MNTSQKCIIKKIYNQNFTVIKRKLIIQQAITISQQNINCSLLKTQKGIMFERFVKIFYYLTIMKLF
jgi:hypothetical protein